MTDLELKRAIRRSFGDLRSRESLVVIRGDHATEAIPPACELSKRVPLSTLILVQLEVSLEIAQLVKASHFRDLAFSGCRITPESFSISAANAESVSFRLMDVQSILLDLGGLSIRSLSLSECTFDDAAQWGFIPSLRRVQAEGSHTRELIMWLGRHKALEDLSLICFPTKERVNLVGLDGSSMERLVAPLTGNSLPHITSWPRVKVLDLGHGEVHDSDVAGIINMQSIEHLGLSYTEITDEAFPLLLSASHLRSINVSGTMISMATIDLIRSTRPDLRVEAGSCPLLPKHVSFIRGDNDLGLTNGLSW